MSSAADPTQTPEVANTERVEGRVRQMAVLGILLTSSVIGGLATTLLYRSQADTLDSQLFFAVQLHSLAIEAELSRLQNLATQVTSRTRIREELERHQRGEIDLERLTEFSVPKLTDALHSVDDMLGVTRLSRDLKPLLEVGMPVPRAAWPRDLSRSGTALGLPQEGVLVVAAPIRSRSRQTVGVDLVIFRDERLRSVMQDFVDNFEHAGSIQIAALEQGRAVHFYDLGHSEPPLPHEALKSLLMQRMQLGIDAGIQPRAIPGRPRQIVVTQPIGETGWVFLFYADAAEFYAQARMHAAFAAFTVLALALLGILLTSRIIRPLVTQLAAETRLLQRLLRHNEELLDTVRSNEAKLQAVIDNAPAVIYIKDQDGRYLLVNNSYEQQVDRPRAQIIGMYDYQLFPDDVAKSTRDTDLEVLATGESITIDEKVTQRDGVHDYLCTKFPLLDARGEIYAVCGIATDITERRRVERSLALTQRTVDQASMGVYWADRHGRLIYLNDAARAALAIDASAAGKIELADISSAFDRHQWPAHWQAVRRTGSLHYEATQRRGDGSVFPVEVHANYLAFEDQEFYIALVHDISARREVEDRLRQSATVFDCSAEAIVITGPDGVVADVNAAFTGILGYTREEVVGRRPNLWKSQLHDHAFYQRMWQSIAETGGWRGEIINRSKDGSITPALVTISAVRNAEGEIASYVAIYTDISQIKESQKQLAHLAQHDALTDLPNRVLFNERLEHCLERAARRGGRVGVIFVDLDHFKNVNDSLGHTFGDRLLVEVAQLLSAQLRGDDTVARIGGDEFTILIEEVDERHDIVAVLEKIIEAFDREFLLGDARVRVTPSLGIAVSPDDGSDADMLMRNADAAMYRAKSLGRNNYQFYTADLTQQAFERMHLDAALRNAIPRGEFHILYQPQIDLSDGRIVGMEALVRWENPELGLVPPDQFIPIAEDNGLILPLGEWILEETCKQARAWLDAGLLQGTLAVNISGVQVRRGDLVAVVRRVLQQTALPADRLELELTESFIMGEAQQAIRILGDLRELGLTLAVDDFGTGYSSLAYLKSLPIHRLKIDKSFIRDIPEDPNDMAITRAVIALAQSLNLDLVGEGVETEVQRRFLLDEGCAYGQGYLFHRPMRAAQMQALLSSPNPVRRANR